jgi:hypothetical protein
MRARTFALAAVALSAALLAALFLAALAAGALLGAVARFVVGVAGGMAFSAWLRYVDARKRALRRREESELRAYATLDCGHSIEILHRAALKTSPDDLADCHFCGDLVRRVVRVQWNVEAPSLPGEDAA